MYIRKGNRALAAVFLLAFLAGGSVCLHAQAVAEDSPATVGQSGNTFRLENQTIGLRCSVAGGRLSGLVIEDRLHGNDIPVAAPFALLLKDGSILDAGNLALEGSAQTRKIHPRADASRAADRIPGVAIEVPLESADHTVHALWSATLRNGSAYIRQQLTITAAGQDVPIARVQLIDLRADGGVKSASAADARVVGSVNGSPIVAGNFFLGFEHPLSQSKVTDGRATAWIDRDLPLRAGQSITYSSVIGVAAPGQMRRAFLAYIEQERAHPYRTFLHYNSWYDLGYFTPYDEASAVDRVNTFGRELVEKRGVKLDSFLFDDGWDDHQSLWKFNSGFPHGFAPVRAAAENFGADPGIWMSPWGGYSKPRQERIAFGRAAGYEIVDGGYALSGPLYYASFRDVCLEMIRKYGVNQFKFDGTGNVNSVVPGSQFDSDFAAAIHLIGELRAARPDIYINLTTGTWPSPFWLIYADSIWRGGDDDNRTGVGSDRERWITYRDAETYRHIVQNGPLYPLNSLMLHGMIYAQHNKYLNTDSGKDFRNEIRSYFGTGTQLQEMYITPGLLTSTNWDDLAEAAKWSRANADVLRDTHWIGGDPAWLEVYGWASWAPRKAILVLRNPSDKPQSISIRLQDALELPSGAAQVYSAASPWKSDAGHAVLTLRALVPHEFRLAPFEVLTLDLTPQARESAAESRKGKL